MTLKLSLYFHHTPLLNLSSSSSPPLRFHSPNSSNLFLVASSNRRRIGVLTARVIRSQEQKCESEDEDELAEKSVCNQMKEIVKFTGPAIGLWLCDPLMSLIDTAVVGQGSSTELAALGIIPIQSNAVINNIYL
ncbi:variant 4 [Lathyrus oleraceus]|uniref:Variant 4 n=1 Tax=Pisum sativum TaxID=3888 RepID=A0A9D4VQP8_PEA|nr:variant 4 [Pisum sativum]